MSNLDDLFSGMAKSSVNDRGAFFTEGLFTVEVKSLEFRNGFKGQSFIAKFEVKESNSAEHQVGVTRSWIVKLDKPKTKDQAMGDIKGLIFALVGVDPKSVKGPELDPGAHEQATKLFKCAIDETYAKASGVDPKALIGKRVKLECTGIKTQPTADKPQGGDFTRHAWSPAAASA
jgi:hypothetical protein